MNLTYLLICYYQSLKCMFFSFQNLMGLFVVAIHLRDRGRRVVLLRPLEVVLNDDGEIVEDEILKCPILKLSRNMEAIPSRAVQGSAALFHACSRTLCKINEGERISRIERTNVTVGNKPVLKCDTDRHPYWMYNRFCYRQ